MTATKASCQDGGVHISEGMAVFNGKDFFPNGDGIDIGLGFIQLAGLSLLAYLRTNTNGV